MRIRFLTRGGCTLCDEALAALRGAASRRKVTIDVIDVDADASLASDYGARVPVVLSDDGEVLAEGVISRREARSVLRRLRRTGG